MNGIEKITERIEQDVRAEIGGIEAEAQRQAEEILARHKAAAERERNELLSRGRTAADERVERLTGVAALDAKKLELAAKQEMLAAAFDKASERLAQMSGDEQVSVLARLAADASRSGKEQIILSQKDRTRFGKRVVTEANALLAGKGKLTLSEASRPMRGGLLLSDGDIEINCTYDSLIRLLRSSITGEVAKVLFG